MVGLGIVLLISGVRGSYAFAGVVSAVYMVANAVMAILLGRVIDRLGQARVLLPGIVVFSASLVALAWVARSGGPVWLSVPLAATAGASLPPVGSCVRARWSHLLREEPAALHTAFALEAVADEAVFIVGPILATTVATAVDPAAGLVSAVVLGGAGTLALVAQRSTEPTPHPSSPETRAAARMPWRTVLTLTVVSAALGCLFGNAEVTTVAFAGEHGSRGYAGPLLALWALGSLVAGLVTGAVTWTAPLDTRLRWGALGMTVAMAPLALVDHVWLMGLALLVAGLAVAPTLIATISLVEARVPGSRFQEGMAFVQTGIVAGVAPGAALGGLVIDAQGANAAYLLSAGAGAVAALTALLVPRAH